MPKFEHDPDRLKIQIDGKLVTVETETSLGQKSQMAVTGWPIEGKVLVDLLEIAEFLGLRVDFFDELYLLQLVTDDEIDFETDVDVQKVIDPEGPEVPHDQLRPVKGTIRRKEEGSDDW